MVGGIPAASEEARAHGAVRGGGEAAQRDARAPAAAATCAVGAACGLDQRSATLEVPQFLHDDEAEINPVQLQRMAAAKAEARRAKMVQMSMARQTRQKRCTRPDGSVVFAEDAGERPRRLDGAPPPHLGGGVRRT